MSKELYLTKEEQKLLNAAKDAVTAYYGDGELAKQIAKLKTACEFYLGKLIKEE
jgi:hypothetical protein